MARVVARPYYWINVARLCYVCRVKGVLDREARKEQLAEAVWQVILERGVGAVSIRTVAEQAGLVVGSLRYVFPSRAELLTFSAELMVRRVTERVRAVPDPGDALEYAINVIAQLLPLDAERRAELEVNLALIGEAPAEPALLSIRDHAHRELQAASMGLVRLVSDDSHGIDRLFVHARRLHALVDGVALHLLHRDPEEGEWALALIREELEAIAQ